MTPLQIIFLIWSIIFFVVIVWGGRMFAKDLEAAEARRDAEALDTNTTES